MSRWSYIVAPDGEKLAAYPEHGDVVTCDGCDRKVDVPRDRPAGYLRPDAGWHLRLTVQTPAWFQVDVQLDVCYACRRGKTLAEIVANASHRFAPDFATELCAAVGVERPW